MRLLLCAVGIATLAGCVEGRGATERSGAETYIPYASSDGIIEWRVVSDDKIYVRALTGGWYVVRVSGPCAGLRYATSLGFETSAMGVLDRFGAVLVERDRCPVESVTRAIAPPLETHRRR